MQTLTSVGYGDIYPITAPGKLIGSFAALSGLLVLALPITIIGANFDEARKYELSFAPPLLLPAPLLLSFFSCTPPLSSPP